MSACISMKSGLTRAAVHPANESACNRNSETAPVPTWLAVTAYVAVIVLAVAAAVASLYAMPDTSATGLVVASGLIAPDAARQDHASVGALASPTAP